MEAIVSALLAIIQGAILLEGIYRLGLLFRGQLYGRTIFIWVNHPGGNGSKGNYPGDNRPYTLPLLGQKDIVRE